jgi:phage N-6-adenine-methyltransferase
VVNRKFGPFTLDAAATPENAKARRFFTKDDDALAQSWGQHEVVWLNPPYSRIAAFTDKALEESQRLIVMLVPARTDTQWWHRLTAHAHVAFLKGRLTFGDGPSCAPFPSALVTIGPSIEMFFYNWDWRKA